MYLHNLPEQLVQPFLNLAYTLMHVDSDVSDDELSTFSLYAIEFNLKELPPCEIVDFKETLGLFKELSIVHKKQVFFELLSLAYADSLFLQEEKELIFIICREFEISKADYNIMLDILENLIKQFVRLGEIVNEI